MSVQLVENRAQRLLREQLGERLEDGGSRVFVQDPGLGLTTVARRFVQEHPGSCAYVGCDPAASLASLLGRVQVKPDRAPSHLAQQASFAFAAPPRLIVIDDAELLGPKMPLLHLVLSIDANSGGERPSLIVLAHDPFPRIGTLSAHCEPGQKGERLCRRLTQRLAPPLEVRYADVLPDIDAIVRAIPSPEPVVVAVRRLCEEGGLDCSFDVLRRAAAFFKRNPDAIDAAAADAIRCMAGEIGYSELVSMAQGRRPAPSEAGDESLAAPGRPRSARAGSPARTTHA